MSRQTARPFATLWTVLRKELRDIARDRRTLLLTLLLGPLIYPVLILGMGRLMESRVRTQIDQPLQVATVGRAQAPNLVAFLAAQGLQAVDPPRDLTRALRDQDIDVALRIGDDYAQAWREGRPALVEIVQ
ncbi:ABC transporter permease, partial [Xanthomonas sp. Kuri4-3]